MKDPVFDGTEEISVRDLKTVAVQSFREAPKKVFRNWDGITPLVFCGLTLSNDNAYIEKSTPVVLGKLPLQTISAQSLWNLKQEFDVKFEDLDLSAFTFNNSMTSDLIDYKQIRYSVTNRNQNLIPEEELTKQGFLGFCIRLYLQPIEVKIIKIIVIIYPMSINELKKTHPLFDNHAFPGILLQQTKATLGPSTNDLLYTNFGSPVLPIVKLSNSLAYHDRIPSSRQICVALSVLFRSVTIPESKTDLKLLLNRWSEIKENGETSLRKLVPGTLWPDIVPSLGKTFFYTFLDLWIFGQIVNIFHEDLKLPTLFLLQIIVFYLICNYYILCLSNSIIISINRLKPL